MAFRIKTMFSHSEVYGVKITLKNCLSIYILYIIYIHIYLDKFSDNMSMFFEDILARVFFQSIYVQTSSLTTCRCSWRSLERALYLSIYLDEFSDNMSVFFDELGEGSLSVYLSR